MQQNLLDQLKLISCDILVNNEFDFDFLTKIKEYYGLKYKVFYEEIKLLLFNDFIYFNYNDGLKYDEKIDKCVFLIDNLNELKNISFNFFYI